MIKIENLSKKFDSKIVLQDINLEFSKGKTVAIIGKSGVGKSTLLRCLNYLEKPNKGRFTIDGQSYDFENISKKEIYNLRKNSAMIFQDFNLFLNKTVIENITTILTVVKKYDITKSKKIAMEYLEKVGMEEYVNTYPIKLSGGQQQRVAIARSLAVEPKLLLFDEPTSALDPTWIKEVLEVIRNLSKLHYTMLIVTHEMNFAKEVADNVIFMDSGKIIEEGLASEIFNNPKNELTKKFLNSNLSNKN